MEKFSKKDIFKTPEGYFEDLSETIIKRHEGEKVRQISVFKKYAAVAVLILGFGIYFLNGTIKPISFEAKNLSHEIDMYINSDFWQAEDILLLADNPNDILDEIIMAEWAEYNWGTDDFEDDIWY